MAEYPALDLHFSTAPSDVALHDRLCALLDDFHPVAIDDGDGGDRWRVFFERREDRAAAARAVGSAFHATTIRASCVEVDDGDWARRSQQDLRAIGIGRLVVAPPWDVPKGMPAIIIEPSTGFGTGHHATTRLCLLLMQRLDLRGARVLDVGTGSGVLALAAWKLGASEVTAIDRDPDALDNARANIARNGAAPAIDVIQDDLGSLRIERADVVLANLTGAVLVRYASELQSLAVAHGYLIVSGVAPEDLPIIYHAFRGLTRIHERSEDEWAAICLRRSMPDRG